MKTKASERVLLAAAKTTPDHARTKRNARLFPLSLKRLCAQEVQKRSPSATQAVEIRWKAHFEKPVMESIAPYT
jgi:hypothetical protein